MINEAMDSEIWMRRTRTILALTIVILSINLILPSFILAEEVTEAWVKTYNGPGSGQDWTGDIALDAVSNIYVAGSSDGGGTFLDYVTIKYDTDGNQLWVARYDGGNNEDDGNALTVDSTGNVYVTGSSRGGGGDSDYATIKYDTNGNELWVARYDGGNNFDDAAALALDSAGNVYVTGRSAIANIDYTAINIDYATIKYDTDGNQLWVARYDGPGNDDDAPQALAVDSTGNIFVTGYSRGSTGYYDYATIKYDSNGNQLWVVRYDGLGHFDDIAYALAGDSAGNVYVTGEDRNGLWDSADSNYATIKYDTDGYQLWVARYDGPGNYDDDAYLLAVDVAGNVYISGSSSRGGGDSDSTTIKYDTNGNELWVARYDR